MKSFPSYAATVDCARMLEMKEMEVHVYQERTRKPKIKQDSVANVIGLLTKDLGLYLTRGNHEGLRDPWDNFL